MKMVKIIGLFCASLTLIACSNRTTYNEAELIRKLDSLQQTVSQLNQRIQELEFDINQIGEKQAAVTTMAPTTTGQLLTSKITTKKPKVTTKKPLTTTSISTQGQTEPVFVLAEFDDRMERFRKDISGLSSDIAGSEPDKDETKKFDQFYSYQEEIRFIEHQINSYQLAMKREYDGKQIEQDVFIEKERQLSKLNDALIALEDQLEVRFGMNDKT